jgi:hypothetical protein
MLGILLLLWMIHFGFGIGGYLVTGLLILVWVVSILMLFIPNEPLKGEP